MRIVILCNDVLANCGLNLIVSNVLKKSKSICLDSVKIEFDYYGSFDEFRSAHEYSNDILCLVHYFQLNAIESNLFVQYIERVECQFPIILYTSDNISDFFMQYLHCLGIHSVITNDYIEDDIFNLFQNSICNRLKKIGVCSFINKNIHDIKNELRDSFNDLKQTLNVESINTSYSNTIPYNQIPYSIPLLSTSSVSCIQDIPSSSEPYDYSKLNCNLTPRKKKLIEGLILGLSNKDIADKSNLSSGTVRNYIHQLCIHYEVKNRTELAIKIRNLIVK